MRRAIYYVVVVAIWVATVFLGYCFTANDSGLRHLFYVVDTLLLAILVTSAIYDVAQKTFLSGNKRIGAFGLLFLCILCCGYFLFYSVGYCVEIWKQYRRNLPIRYVNQLMEADPVLGIKSKPGASAYLQHYNARDTVYINADGLRVSRVTYQQNDSPDSGNISLFLGCSFTFGFFCATHESYPERVCAKLGSRCYNGGTNSFGLAQMNILLEQVLTKYKPQRVFVQYSSWLPWRSKLYYLPISTAAVPNPYYYKKAEAILRHAPFFKSGFYSLNLPSQPVSATVFVKLCLLKIIPFYTKEFFQKTYSALLIRSKTFPQAHNNLQEIEKAGYTALYRMCEAKGATMYLVALGNRSNTEPPAYLNENANYCFVNTDSTLLNAIKNGGNYDRLFCHTTIRGGDTVVLDRHLNSYANELISKTILQTVKAHESKYHSQ